MGLPFAPPLAPMLSKAAGELPSGEGWQFEPKWDGFRTIVFRDGASLTLQSREGKSLNRYFPDLVAALEKAPPSRCVLDGEIVIAGKEGLDFEALLLRIHPAASRVALLATETPASLVVWDLLALGSLDLRDKPLASRRARLERALAKAKPPIHLSPATRERAVAADWFRRFEGAGLDGVVAKRLEGRYEAGVRAMLKLKHARTADCVIAGFRWHKGGEGTRVGSLLLGLYDDAGVLHHVGIAAAFSEAAREALVKDLAPLRRGAASSHPWLGGASGGTQRVPGATSRWSRGKDLSFEPLRPERVCEVAYDHMQGARFRHAAQFLRFRPDRSPASCRYDQLEVSPPYELARIFRAETSARR